MTEVAFEATLGLDEHRRTHYADMLLAALGDTARRALEAIMAKHQYEFQSDYAKHYIAVGRREARREDLVRILTSRGIDVPEVVRERISEAEDIAQLEIWMERAATAESLDDVFR